MVKILKLTYGTFPKTEKLRVRIGRWGRKVLDARELEDLMKEETELFQRLARDSGISAFTDPLFNWFDIFRPFSQLSGGIELGPLTRYGETNTFYRLPEVRGRLSLSGKPAAYGELQENPPLPLYHVDQGEDQLAFLPGPVTFFHFCGNIAGNSFEDFSEQLGKLYAQILSEFKFQKIFVFESVPLGSANLAAFYNSIDPAKTVLFTTGAINEKILSTAGAKFHSVITDPDNANIQAAIACSIIPGLALIDAHNTKLEEPGAITEQLESLGKQHNVATFYVTHSDYLDFLPRQIAEKKIKLLGQVGE